MYTRTSLFENRAKKIEIVDNRIEYTLKHYSMTFYFTYTNVLLSILMLRSIHPYLWKPNKDTPNSKGRLRFKTKVDGVRLDIAAEDLAMGCYLDWIESNNIENIQTGLSRIKHHKTDNNLDIDHLDSFVRNITQYNINFMDSKLNSKKKDLTRRFLYPAGVDVCYFDKKYYRVFHTIVKLPFPTSKGTIILTGVGDFYFFSETAEEFVWQLNERANNNITLEDYIVSRAPRKKGVWENKNERKSEDYVLQSISAQGIIVAYYLDKFTHPDKDDNSIILKI